MDEQKMLKLQTWVKEAKRIVFFGGAGVSTESGFRIFAAKTALSPALCLSARNHHFPFVLSPSSPIFSSILSPSHALSERKAQYRSYEARSVG